MRIAVLGAGSIGCLIAAKLVEAGHEVLVHARGEHGAILAISGLKVSGVWDFEVSPNQWTVSLDEAGIHLLWRNLSTNQLSLAKLKIPRNYRKLRH